MVEVARKVTIRIASRFDQLTSVPSMVYEEVEAIIASVLSEQVAKARAEAREEGFNDGYYYANKHLDPPDQLIIEAKREAANAVVNAVDKCEDVDVAEDQHVLCVKAALEVASAYGPEAEISQATRSAELPMTDKTPKP